MAKLPPAPQNSRGVIFRVCVFCPPSSQQSEGRPAAYGQGSCLSAAGVGTAAFRTEQPIQTVFQPLHLVSTVCTGAHQGTGQSIHTTLQKSPAETSSSRNNLSHWATRLDRENSTWRPSPSTTSIPRAGREHRALSGAVLQRQLTLFPRVAHACPTACPPPGRGDSAQRRLLSSCKTERVFAGELALPLGYRAPQSGKPSSQARLKCNSTLKKCPGFPGTSKPVGEVVSVPAGTSQPGLRVVFLSSIIRLGTERNVDA